MFLQSLMSYKNLFRFLIQDLLEIILVSVLKRTILFSGRRCLVSSGSFIFMLSLSYRVIIIYELVLNYTLKEFCWSVAFEFCR